MNPLLATDGYKTGHHLMYPEDTTMVYSNFTPRSGKRAPEGVTDVVSFGQQMTMRMIDQIFEEHFFDLDEDVVCDEMERHLSVYLGAPYNMDHFRALHKLGFLPIEVMAIPEGLAVPFNVPVLTIRNTDPEFFWVTNYLETLISNLLWKPMTSATIARQYHRIMMQATLETDPEAVGLVPFLCHDFSMRGLDSLGATISSGLGHAVYFLGSDSLPVIYGAEQYYDADPDDGPVIMSVNATEHSVMCAGGAEVGDELNTFRNLMETFPSGILSVVSDTWDLWKVLTEYLPVLKPEIMARDGKLVIRPDSGDPVDILCGTQDFTDKHPDHQTLKEARTDYPYTPEHQGVIELLWDTFGGTTNEEGYKVLDPHIGAIYGDSITLDRAKSIHERLKSKGFATTNVVLGIGSFTYQYNTRDTFGTAMKATYVEIAGASQNIFKDPVTDDGEKKSAKGLLKVEMDSDGKLVLLQEQSFDDIYEGILQVIYTEGEFWNETNLTEVRERARAENAVAEDA
jgi:nicotinamide phosphoribosyltransferase